MNAVIYYSNAGESKRVATYVSNKTEWTLLNLKTLTDYRFDTAVLVFPVYCQNVPNEVKTFLNKLTAQNVAIIATYGKMSFGNVLNEIQRKYSFNIIAAAYVPTKHAYKQENRFEDFSRLDGFAEKLNNPSPVTVPRCKKNAFANFFPKLRSRLGVRIIKNTSLCNNCGLCADNCTRKAIENGKTNGKCIRCTQCVNICPQHALTVKTAAVMRAYLSKEKENKLIIYV